MKMMNQELFEKLKQTLERFECISHVKFHAGSFRGKDKKPTYLEFKLEKLTDELRVIKLYGVISDAISRNFPGIAIEYANSKNLEEYNPLIRTITFRVKDSSALPCKKEELITRVVREFNNLIEDHL